MSCERTAKWAGIDVGGRRKGFHVAIVVSEGVGELLALTTVHEVAGQLAKQNPRLVAVAPRTPLERVLACPEITPEVAADLQQQRARLDPCALAATIDTKLERIFALANPHHRPQASTDRPAPVAVRRRVPQHLSNKPAPQRP